MTKNEFDYFNDLVKWFSEPRIQRALTDGVRYAIYFNPVTKKFVVRSAKSFKLEAMK
jgi:hypothetical protein